jgi:hypothetical protein
VALGCDPGRWATWDGLRPSADPLSFDGFGWRRDGAVIAGERSRGYVPAGSDAGAQLACQETVTYPPPLNVTAADAGRAQRVSP